MWPFKRKTKTTPSPKEGEVSIPCVVNTILKDIEKCSPEGWMIYHTRIFEKFSHPQLKYTLIASTFSDNRNDVSIEGVHCSVFSASQSFEIKNKLIRIRNEMDRIKKENDRKAELAKLTNIFPNCVT